MDSKSDFNIIIMVLAFSGGLPALLFLKPLFFIVVAFAVAAFIVWAGAGALMWVLRAIANSLA